MSESPFPDNPPWAYRRSSSPDEWSHRAPASWRLREASGVAGLRFSRSHHSEVAAFAAWLGLGRGVHGLQFGRAGPAADRI